MGRPAAKAGDTIAATDTHIVIVPIGTAQVPVPLFHVFNGKLSGNLSNDVRIMGRPAATVGSVATNTVAHLPTAPGIAFQRVPSNRGRVSRGSGSVRINGTESAGMPTFRIAHLGVGYCPEERGIFASLSCEENLLLPPPVGGALGGGMSLAEIYEMFPNLYERRHSPGTRLSGGEQQMLAVARILRTGANLLLLDEISEGLAPVIVQALARMFTALKARGYTIVMVEQNFRFAAPLADRFYVMEHGQIVEHFEAAELSEKQDTLNELLGV